VAGLVASGSSGWFAAKLALAGRPPDFCLRHPDHWACRITSTTSSSTSTTTTTVPAQESLYPWAWSSWFGPILAA
jgi:hypothetical protein